MLCRDVLALRLPLPTPPQRGLPFAARTFRCASTLRLRLPYARLLRRVPARRTLLHLVVVLARCHNPRRATARFLRTACPPHYPLPTTPSAFVGDLPFCCAITDLRIVACLYQHCCLRCRCHCLYLTLHHTPCSTTLPLHHIALHYTFFPLHQTASNVASQ